MLLLSFHMRRSLKHGGQEGFATLHVFLSECLISAQAGCAYFSTEF